MRRLAASVCVVLLCLLAGCETWEGAKRDWQTVLKADDWFKEHYW